MAKIIIFCLISSRVINIFGRKPVRGGSPARERRISIVVAVIAGFLVHEVATCDIFVEDRVIRERNMAVVIIIYRVKLNRES